jgi:hypothetical protein
VTPRVYSSMEAFVTHWRALREAEAQAVQGLGAPLSAFESELLRPMEAVLELLDPAERAALEAASTDGAPVAASARARRRQRALAKLAPILIAAGWLQ